MSAGFTDLVPLHLPQTGHTGIALSSEESAYPELWEGHVSSLAPCIYGHGEVFPFIGAGPAMRDSATAGLRQWAWQGSIATNHDEMSPIGYSFYTGPGAFVFVRGGHKAWVPWLHQDSDPDAPHSYVAVFKLPTSHVSTTFQHLYHNVPRLFNGQTYKGEHLVFNTNTMTPQIWAGGDTSNVISIGCNQIFTQDDTLIEDKWHAIAWTVHDWTSPPDIRLAIDGRMYPAANMLQSGNYANDPVYCGTGGQGPPLRFFHDLNKTSNDISLALLQVYGEPLSDQLMEEHTADPLKMFWPQAINRTAVSNVPAATTKKVFLGRLAGMSETVLAHTSQ